MLPVIAAAAGGLIGAYGNYASARESASIGAKSAREQMAFQERMSNTAYQRAANDLQKAGLNRVIALGNPATTPSGAGYSMPDARLGSSALEGAAKVAQVENLYEQNKLLSEQARIAGYEADKQKVTKSLYEAFEPIAEKIRSSSVSGASGAWDSIKGNVQQLFDEFKRSLDLPGIGGKEDMPTIVIEGGRKK